MTANPIWVAGEGAAPPSGISAAPVWIAGYGPVAGATEAQIVGYGKPPAGANPVWIAGYGGPPPAAIGASPIWISGFGGGGGASAPASVWSASDAAATNMTLSDGGKTVTCNVASWNTIRGTVSKSSGKLYFEYLFHGVAVAFMPGVGSSTIVIVGNFLGNSNFGVGFYSAGANAFLSMGAGAASVFSTTFSIQPGDVMGLAIDLDAGKIWLSKNNSWMGGNPGTNTTPQVTYTPSLVAPFFPAISLEEPGLSVTLQSTAASQKYAPPAGFSAWDAAAPAHSAQALAYLARTTGGNEGGNGENIATLIDGLVADGVWAKLDALYVLAQQNQADARLNLISASYGLTGSATFTAYQGFSAFPVGGLDTGLKPTTSVQFTLNSAGIGAWAYNAPSVIGIFLGTSASGNQVTILPRFSDGNYYVGINASNGSSATPSLGNGWYSADRTGLTTVPMYFNAVLKNTDTVASSGLDAIDFAIGDTTTTGYAVTSTISAAFIGASLGAAGQLALYNRLRTYMTSIGVP